MKTGIGCAVLLYMMGSMAGAAASGNIAGSIESDPIDSAIDSQFALPHFLEPSYARRN